MLEIPIRRLLLALLLTLVTGCEVIEGEYCDDTFTTCEGDLYCYTCENADNEWWTEGRCATSHEAAQAFCDDSGTVSGGGGGACSSPYSGPTSDVQSSSFCKAAYNYKCAGDQQKVDANCAYYRQFQQDNPGLASCPYCN